MNTPEASSIIDNRNGFFGFLTVGVYDNDVKPAPDNAVAVILPVPGDHVRAGVRDENVDASVRGPDLVFAIAMDGASLSTAELDDEIPELRPIIASRAT